jgi:hyperosmotically inducible protein
MEMNTNKIFMMIFLSFLLALAGCQKEGTEGKTGQKTTSGAERSGAGMGSTQGSESSPTGNVTEPGRTGGAGTSPDTGTSSGGTGASPDTGTSPGGTGTSPSSGMSPGGAETTLEKTGEYMDDSVITAKIKQDILGDPLLKSSQINVTTENGVVKLSGSVDSQQTIDRVKAIAQSVTDVKAVESDQLVVK